MFEAVGVSIYFRTKFCIQNSLAEASWTVYLKSRFEAKEKFFIETMSDRKSEQF